MKLNIFYVFRNRFKHQLAANGGQLSPIRNNVNESRILNLAAFSSRYSTASYNINLCVGLLMFAASLKHSNTAKC